MRPIDPNTAEVERVVAPGDAFYRTYTAAQIEAVVAALEDDAEFPYELTYLGGGSALWHAGETASGADAAVRGDQDSLLTRYAEALLALAPVSRQVRVVDLGPGTARPVSGLLRHLLDRSRLVGYRGIDMSAELLEVARQHLRAEFPEVADGFDLRHGDFTGPDLAQVLAVADDAHHDGPGPARYVVLAGGTLFNFADPGRVLRHVGEAMREEDVLLLTLRVDTGVDRPPFMDRVSVGGPYKPQQLSGLDLLDIDRSWYVPETGYDPERSEVFVRVRFTEPVAIKFTVESRSRTVQFSAGDTVVVWRYLYLDHHAVVDQLARNGFTVRLFERGESGQMVLVAATPAGRTGTT